MGYPAGNNKKKTLTEEVNYAKQKIARYCAYQERAHSEVEQKLYSFKLSYDQVHELLAWLITENYLNEERFAIAFAGGRFRIKNWGRIKIENHLQQKKVSDYSINRALDQFTEREYKEKLTNLIRSKANIVSAQNLHELRKKVAQFVINKGFEPDLVWQLVKTIIE